MKILAIHNAYHPDQAKRPAVDSWRIARPLAELKKHCPDWQIDERPTVIPNLTKYKDPKDFTEAELEKAFKDICSYDIVFSSYHANPTIYTLLQVARNRAGTQYVMDADDDMFAINPDNPVWAKVNDENVYHMQRMIADNAWISTTTEALAEVFRARRPEHAPESVFINPNYLTDDYKHPKFDNKDKVVIGFFGGSSHYGDIHRTGVMEAVAKIMHEHKNVHFKSVGMPIDTYLPKARYHFTDGQRGDGWLKELYPNLNMDIAIGPLEDNIFNLSKSNIKWQEATRAGAAFVASKIGPYAPLSSKVARTCQNTPEAWYTVLKALVVNGEYRRELVSNAQAKLTNNYRLEDNWMQYYQMFDTVYNNKEIPDVHRQTSQKPTVLQA